MVYDIFYDKLEKCNGYVTSVTDDVLDVTFRVTLLAPMTNSRVPDLFSIQRR